MRIVSFLPAATEILLALGAGDDLVGISHESREIAAVRHLPVLTRLNYDESRLSGEEIDHWVQATYARGESVYRIDEALLRGLRPDLLVAQELCEVCAITPNDLQRLLASLESRPKLLNLSAHTLEQAFADMQTLARAVGRAAAGERLVATLRRRAAALAARAPGTLRRVFCLEWPRPLYNSGHWVPEQIALAGGRDELARTGEKSTAIGWERLRAYDPEIVVAAICGFDRPRALRELDTLRLYPGFERLRAVRDGQVWVLDGPTYFSQAGPALIAGAEILARVFHPQIFGPPSAAEAIRWPTAPLHK